VPNGTTSKVLRRSAAAFAPAAITNFFQIHYDRSGHPDGATGGGYVLSKGTESKVTFVPNERFGISTVVNGDSDYNARTTHRALDLFAAAHPFGGKLVVEQRVDTPIGSGFGASAASAISAVYAASAALGLRLSKHELASYAHRAEIIERTGLGTVSVAYRGIGAGAIIKAGEPGIARFRIVKTPGDLRIVTAFLAPYDKNDAISSRTISKRIDILGRQALASFLQDPTLETLTAEGEKFSKGLGLESRVVKKLISVAKSSGALSASQNMIGYAIHALADEDRCGRVQAELRRAAPAARVDVFRVGGVRAGVIGPSHR
jgi:pantoate kinase